MMRLAFCGSDQNGASATEISPESGLRRPEIIEMVVVLPAPLGPNRP